MLATAMSTSSTSLHKTKFPVIVRSHLPISSGDTFTAASFSRNFLVRHTKTQVQDSKIELIFEIEKYHELNKKVLHLRLLDTEDSLFYFELKLDEQEYIKLATEQNILAGFEEFPARLQEFVNLILSRANDANPKFYAQIVIDDSTGIVDADSGRMRIQFNVMENNSFKQIRLISLNFIQVADDTVKARLIDLNRRYKQELTGVQNRLADTERHLTNRLKEVAMEKEAMLVDLRNSKNKFEESIRDIFSKIGETMDPDTSRLNDSFHEGLSMSYGSSPDSWQSTISNINRLNSKITDLQRELSNARSSNQVLELKLDETTMRFEEAQSLCKRLTSELDRCRSRSQRDDGTNLELNETIRQLNTDLQRSEEKVSLLKGELYHLRNEYFGKDKGDLQSRISSLDQTCESHKMDLEKANETVQKLQGELRQAKNKSKRLSADCENTQKKCEEFETVLIKLQAECQANREAAAADSNKRLEAEEAKMHLENELKLAKATVEKNEKTIDWLHRQLKDSGKFGIPGNFRPTTTLPYPIAPTSTSTKLDESGPQVPSSYGPMINYQDFVSKIPILKTPQHPNTVNDAFAGQRKFNSPPQPTEYPIKPSGNPPQ